MFETFLSSSLLIVFTLIFRTCFRKKISRRFTYLLWIIPAFRLIVMPLFSVPERMSVIRYLTNFFNGFTIYGIYANESIASTIIINMKGFFSSDMVFFLWLIGMILVLSYHMIQYLRLACQLKKSKVFVKNLEGDKLRVFMSDDIKSPFILGFSIYIPSDYRDNYGSFELILSHERCHFVQWDELWNLVRILVSAIYWYSPFVWLAVVKSRDDSEHSCDERITENMNKNEKSDYAKLLIQISTGITLRENNSYLKADIAKSVIYSRVENIITPNNRSRKLEAVILLFMVVIMILTANTGL